MITQMPEYQANEKLFFYKKIQNTSISNTCFYEKKALNLFYQKNAFKMKK